MNNADYMDDPRPVNPPDSLLPDPSDDGVEDMLAEFITGYIRVHQKAGDCRRYADLHKEAVTAFCRIWPL